MFEYNVLLLCSRFPVESDMRMRKYRLWQITKASATHKHKKQVTVLTLLPGWETIIKNRSHPWIIITYQSLLFWLYTPFCRQGKPAQWDFWQPLVRTRNCDHTTNTKWVFRSTSTYVLLCFKFIFSNRNQNENLSKL